ncbi:MAG: sugar phosphate isomerase/epimerase [Firmicutes bacterium]|nr:sugar phosphate isomerase/epimerase [Bacillota bacterium]
MRYSTMVRCVGERNNLDNYFAFLDILKKSEIPGANLSFSEIQELLTEDFDQDGFAERFLSYGIPVRYAHAPMHYPFLFNRTDGKQWETEMMVGLETAAKCGVTDYVIHPGSVVDEDQHYLPKASAERNMAYLYPYVKRGAELGVRIAIENGVCQPWDEDPPVFKDMSPGFEELIEITDGFNEAFGKEVCGICFDFGHANLQPYEIGDAIRMVGNRLRVTHVHDNDGKLDQHLPIGEGTIDWDSVSRALKDIEYDRELSLEMYYGGNETFASDPVGYLNYTFVALKKL